MNFQFNQEQLTKTLTDHAKTIFSSLILVLVAIGVWAGWQTYSSSVEKKYQSEYAQLEKKINDTQTALEKQKPSMNLEKDYGTLVSDLESFIKNTPASSIAAKSAALRLSDLYSEYKDKQKAKETLSPLVPSATSHDFVGALLLHKYASLNAELGGCEQALGTWGEIIKSEKTKFLHNDVKLKMGLCFESLNKLKEAEDKYTEVATQNNAQSEDLSVKEAQKYLRLLKMKKSGS